MSKLFYLFLCLAGCQIALSFPVDEPDFQPVDVDPVVEAEVRSFWDGLFNVLKKALKVEGLRCQGASCETCLNVFGKGGCISITYNKQQGANAALEAKVTTGSRQLWAGSLNAGKSVPSCVKLPSPVKEVCLQNFQANVGSNGRPEGDLCFVVNFKGYSLGVKQCASWRGNSLHGNAPQIIKT